MLNQKDFKKLPIFIISMAGKAVITTNFSEDIASFVDSIYLANNHEEFLKMIPIAILDNSLEKKYARFDAAQGNAWENRVALLWDLAWEKYQTS